MQNSPGIPYVSAPDWFNTGIPYLKQKLLTILTDRVTNTPPTEQQINQKTCELLGYALDEITPGRTKINTTIPKKLTLIKPQ